MMEAFVSIPPCSGGVALKRLLAEIDSEFGDQVEVVIHTGPGDPCLLYTSDAADDNRLV